MGSTAKRHLKTTGLGQQVGNLAVGDLPYRRWVRPLWSRQWQCSFLPLTRLLSGPTFLLLHHPLSLHLNVESQLGACTCHSVFLVHMLLFKRTGNSHKNGFSNLTERMFRSGCCGYFFQDHPDGEEWLTVLAEKVSPLQATAFSFRLLNLSAKEG